ncbi:MAG: type III-A CRISPR-associated protein Cas10/Csm1 [Candidatus Hydrogenedentales bacterium]|jgi:CRISPR-associated protein Csm1
MNSLVERVATAALLHDIGKFWSRTRQEPPFTEQEQAHFGTYAHALWSAHFVERHLGDAELASWVRMHHSPDSRESRLIALADWLSSAERAEDPTQTRGRPEAASLANIFGNVTMPGVDAGALRQTHFPLVAHGELGNAFMPSSEVRCTSDDYEALWKAFLETLSGMDPQSLGHKTLLSLMRRYCSRIPSATPTTIRGYVPDINLYDHSRSVAALAACFAADAMTEDQASTLQAVMRNPGDPRATEGVCQLACGTLSGIQDFIYTIASKQAAKTLRGRSFALQLVADVCAEQVCEKAGVPACCIIYNGGGRFYALLPLGVDAGRIGHEISRHVHTYFKGQVALHVGAVLLSPSDFKSGSFASRWGEASLEANRLKAQRLTALAADDYDDAFGYVDEGGPDTKCSVCSRNEAEDMVGEDRVCPVCRHYSDLGQQLRDARWLVRTELSNTPEGLNEFCALFGFEMRLVSERGANTPRVREIVELNGYNPARAREVLRPPADTIFAYRFLAQAWPRNEDGHVKTFEDLAASSLGACKLGVFRADVDNLGALFALGLGKEATISRVSSLSAALSDFFEGYLNHLTATRYGDTVGIIYSGGDDVFVVGAWDAAVDFAIDLRARLAEFTGNHPSVTLSGGVAVIDDHLPLRYAADLAQDAEEAAKSYERGGLVKNALTLFDMSIGFEEFGRFHTFQRLIMGMLTDTEQPLPKAFLRRLYDIWETYLREHQLIQKNRRGATLDAIRAEARWQRWRWTLAYNLHRFTRRHEAWKKEIDEVRDRILDVKEPIDDRLGVPLRWTELLLKEED